MSIDPEVAKLTQAIFDHACGRSMRAYRLIASLLAFMRHGAASARESFFAHAADAARELVARPDFGTPEQREAALRALPETAKGAASKTVEDATVAAEAASIVFMHSMLDAATHDYCQVCALIDPMDWLPRVEADKVTLAQARGDWNDLLRVAVAREMNRLKNESLPRKIESLQAICKPGSAEILNGYSYDADRMKRIDAFRHELVHEQVVKSSTDALADVEFMERTQVYLSALVTHRHGLKLGPDAVEALLD